MEQSTFFSSVHSTKMLAWTRLSTSRIAQMTGLFEKKTTNSREPWASTASVHITRLNRYCVKHSWREKNWILNNGPWAFPHCSSVTANGCTKGRRLSDIFSSPSHLSSSAATAANNHHFANVLSCLLGIHWCHQHQPGSTFQSAFLWKTTPVQFSVP